MPLHKNGDKEEVGNYNGIASSCSVARRSGRFGEDSIFTEAQGELRGVCESKWEKKTSHLAFLDVSKT